jgi:hypothetical protein
MQSATVGRVAYAFQGDPSTSVRVAAWAATPGIVLQHPFGGVQNDPQVLARLDNNSALNFFGQLGLVGGLPLLALVTVMVVLAMRNLWRTLGCGLPWPAGAAALATICALVSQQFFGPAPDVLHTPLLWCLLGLTWISQSDDKFDTDNSAKAAQN